MTNQHPITPPPELVEQWRNLPEYISQLRTMSTVTITTEKLQHIATQAAQWGADQELEACCKWLEWQKLVSHQNLIAYLRVTRRPKPPSLKAQAYDALDTYIYGEPDPKDKERTYNTIRRALEQLDE